MNLRPLRPNEIPQPIWLKSPPPLSTGAGMSIYRGVQSNVRMVGSQFLRPQDVGAGGIMSRDPAAAWDTVYNHSANALVESGHNEGGVACVHLPSIVWNELVQSGHLVERTYKGWFPYQIGNSTEMRVCSAEAVNLINRNRVTIELASTHHL